MLILNIIKKTQKDISRDKMKKLRSKVSESKRKESSFNLCHRLEYFLTIFQLRHIAVFHPIDENKEIDISSIWKFYKNSNRVFYFPKMNGESLNFYLVDNFKDGFSVGYSNILEPSDYCAEVDSSVFDVILTPGLAFDLKGSRLGYGKGFYDKFLKILNFKTIRVGVGFSFQLFWEHNLPSEKWDQHLDWVITDKELIRCFR